MQITDLLLELIAEAASRLRAAGSGCRQADCPSWTLDWVVVRQFLQAISRLTSTLIVQLIAEFSLVAIVALISKEIVRLSLSSVSVLPSYEQHPSVKSDYETMTV